MDLKKLTESESGKFIYNILIGIATTGIMEFSGLISSDIIVPICVKNKLLDENKERSKEIDFNNLIVLTIRNIVLVFLIYIIVKNFTK